MRGNADPLSLTEAGAAFFGSSGSDLPSDTEVLERSLIGEAIRLALSTGPLDETGWRSQHILYVRSWTIRKLRALFPDLESPDRGSDRFTQTLREGPGGDMMFLGDVIGLAGGYLMPSPTRVVPVNDDVHLLISGLPTRAFTDRGLELHVEGLSRTIHLGVDSLVADLGIPMQTPASYVGTTAYQVFDGSALASLIDREERRSWLEAGNWQCYQGNRGGYGFEYREQYHSVSSPLGYISLWKSDDDFGADEHWLRIKKKGAEEMVRIPGEFVRPTCLLIDLWSDNQRQVVFGESNGSLVLRAKFPPPAAQMRWIHAVGGRWIGSKDGWIRWTLPSGTAEATADMFQRLPVVIRGEGI